jgi:hypothetical protein
LVTMITFIIRNSTPMYKVYESAIGLRKEEKVLHISI